MEAMYPYFESMILLTVVALFIVLILLKSRKGSKVPFNWPLLGMSPTIACNLPRYLDVLTEILESTGGILASKGFWFANLDLFFTSDPANVHHIMTTKFSKYPKGIEWRKRFDIFGDSFFNVDSDEWKQKRGFVKAFLNHQSVRELIPKLFADSMEKIMIPNLQLLSKQDKPVALNQLFGDHLFSIACGITFGFDISSFQQTCNSHEHVFSTALADACEGIFCRYIQPESSWRLQRWLGIGKEKRLKQATVTLHNLISEYISAKERNVGKDQDTDFSFLNLLSQREELGDQPSSTFDEFTRDTILIFMLAVHDTTSTTLSWFFYLLSKNPIVAKRIREEIQKYFPGNGETKWLSLDAKELRKMVYLHAALCETLRLYPPVPLQSRTSLQDDTLPSGHKIDQGTKIVICTYSIGRMTSVWGEDCLEFKPERWITDDGGIKYEPTHKFFAFNSGPRTCLGKDFAMNWMKAITSTILHNYDIQVIDNRQINPRLSIILHMNRELMVALKKRQA